MVSVRCLVFGVCWPVVVVCCLLFVGCFFGVCCLLIVRSVCLGSGSCCSSFVVCCLFNAGVVSLFAFVSF